MPNLTTYYSLNKPLVNNATDQDLWGGYLNDNMDTIDTTLNTLQNVVKRSITTTDTVLTTDRNKILLGDATSASYVETLLAAATAGDGFEVTLKKTDATVNTITIDGAGTETIDGALTYVMRFTGQSVTLISDGTNWQVKSAFNPLTRKYTIWIPAAAMYARTTSGAATGSYESTTNKVMQKTFDFDAVAVEYVEFAIAMPKSYDLGTLNAQFIWRNASGSGTAIWAIQLMAAGDGDTIDTAFGTAVTVSDTASTGKVLISSETTAITASGTPAQGDLFFGQVYRNGGTLAVDASLLGLRLTYTGLAVSDA